MKSFLWELFDKVAALIRQRRLDRLKEKQNKAEQRNKELLEEIDRVKQVSNARLNAQRANTTAGKYKGVRQ